MLLPRKKICRKKKKSQLDKAHVHMHMGMDIFVNKEKIHLHLVFSPFQDKNILVGPEKKHLGSTIYFPSLPPNQKYSKKKFLPIFSLKFFIHPISPPNIYICVLIAYVS